MERENRLLDRCPLGHLPARAFHNSQSALPRFREQILRRRVAGKRDDRARDSDQRDRRKTSVHLAVREGTGVR